MRYRISGDPFPKYKAVVFDLSKADELPPSHSGKKKHLNFKQSHLYSTTSQHSKILAGTFVDNACPRHDLNNTVNTFYNPRFLHSFLYLSSSRRI